MTDPARPAPPGRSVLRLGDPPLRDLTGRGVTVVVVDSGVHADHPHVGGVAGGVCLAPDAASEDDYTDRLGHGTAVIAAIKEKAPGATVYAAKVFERTLSTTSVTLVRAIDWALERGAQLINLSLGTNDHRREALLAEAVARAREAGAWLVSPAEHGGRRWLPGSLPLAAGVHLDWDCPRHEIRFHGGAGAPLRFHASGYPRPIPGVSPDHNLKGVSFAAANVTGVLARALEMRPESVEVVAWLGELAS